MSQCDSQNLPKVLQSNIVEKLGFVESKILICFNLYSIHPLHFLHVRFQNSQHAKNGMKMA